MIKYNLRMIENKRELQNVFYDSYQQAYDNMKISFNKEKKWGYTIAKIEKFNAIIKSYARITEWAITEVSC